METLWEEKYSKVWKGIQLLQELFNIFQLETLSKTQLHNLMKTVAQYKHLSGSESGCV